MYFSNNICFCWNIFKKCKFKMNFLLELVKKNKTKIMMHTTFLTFVNIFVLLWTHCLEEGINRLELVGLEAGGKVRRPPIIFSISSQGIYWTILEKSCKKILTKIVLHSIISYGNYTILHSFDLASYSTKNVFSFS